MPGRYFSVMLSDVTYSKIEHLEPSDRSESIGSATRRVLTSIEVRSRGHKWK